LAVVSIGLLTLVGSASVGLGLGVHAPRVHDEFSYLLAADTFAHGRLTNPPHPMWQHFETYHVNQQPTYASKYPPAQGIFLALGQVLAGRPIVGVWLSVALLCASVCWMLLGWLPLRWALLGGLLAMAQYGIAGPWSQTYWGGAVAATGGALVYGATLRIVREPSVRSAVVLGVGLALLANSRPYEGAVSSLPAAFILAAYLIRRRAEAGLLLRRIVLPLGVVLGLTFSWMALYNARLTGDPLRMSYDVNRETYQSEPLFLFQPMRPAPEYRHPSMEETYLDWTHHWHDNPGPVSAWPAFAAERLGPLWNFYLGIALSPPLLALPWVLKERWARVFSVAILLTLGSNLVTTYGGWPRYSAPITGCLIALVVASLRRAMAFEGPLRHAGRLFALTSVTLAVVLLGLRIENHPQHPGSFGAHRTRILQSLEGIPGDHLVVVQYAQDHLSDQEWVYNEADIDAARVVWARAMNEEKDRELLEYFTGRQAWHLRLGRTEGKIIPHPLAKRPPGQA